jgi:hypothetical protein
VCQVTGQIIATEEGSQTVGLGKHLTFRRLLLRKAAAILGFPSGSGCPLLWALCPVTANTQTQSLVTIPTESRAALPPWISLPVFSQITSDLAFLVPHPDLRGWNGKCLKKRPIKLWLCLLTSYMLWGKSFLNPIKIIVLGTGGVVQWLSVCLVLLALGTET